MLSGALNKQQRNEILLMFVEMVSKDISFEEGYSDCICEEIITINFSKMAAKKSANWWKCLLNFDCEVSAESDAIWACLVVLPFIR